MQVIDKNVLSWVLGKESASRQRQLFLNSVSDTKIVVFGNNEWEKWKKLDLKNIRYKGFTDIRTESAGIFAKSKININLQRIYALDGLSDRVFNIIAAGGFLLTNRVAPLEELFEPGKHFDHFDSIQEMNYKIKYYLKHEEYRKKIALEGQKFLYKNHRLSDRIKILLNKCKII